MCPYCGKKHRTKAGARNCWLKMTFSYRHKIIRGDKIDDSDKSYQDHVRMKEYFESLKE